MSSKYENAAAMFCYTSFLEWIEAKKDVLFTGNWYYLIGIV